MTLVLTLIGYALVYIFLFTEFEMAYTWNIKQMIHNHIEKL